MPSPQPIIHSMTEVNKELQVHFQHLSNPEVDASDRETIGIHAAEGVRRGFNLMLDELEQEALAVQS